LLVADLLFVFFFSSRRRHTRSKRDWSSDVCSSDLTGCFMLMNIGNTPSPSAAGLITTATASTVLRPQYALEGSVFVGGAVVQWRSEERRVGKEGGSRGAERDGMRAGGAKESEITR